MKRFTDAVERDLTTGNWYAALAVALTLPDVCGRLESPKAGVGARYKAWWTTYCLSRYQSFIGPEATPHTFLSAGDAYALRCAYLHEGSGDIEEQNAREVLLRFQFTTPPPMGGLIHCNQSGLTLQLQVDIFCRDVCAGVEAWSRATAPNLDIKQRIATSLIGIHTSDSRVCF